MSSIMHEYDALLATKNDMKDVLPDEEEPPIEPVEEAQSLQKATSNKFSLEASQVFGFKRDHPQVKSVYQWPTPERAQIWRNSEINIAALEVSSVEWYKQWGSIFNLRYQLNDGTVTPIAGSQKTPDAFVSLPAERPVHSIRVRVNQVTGSIECIVFRDAFNNPIDMIEGDFPPESGSWEVFKVKAGQKLIGYEANLDAYNNIRGLAFITMDAF